MTESEKMQEELEPYHSIHSHEKTALLLSLYCTHANPYMEAIKLHSAVYKYINRCAHIVYA